MFATTSCSLCTTDSEGQHIVVGLCWLELERVRTLKTTRQVHVRDKEERLVNIHVHISLQSVNLVDRE